MKSSLAILKKEEVVVGRVEVGDIHHRALRVRLQGALVALLGRQEEPKLGAVAAVARVALVGPPGKQLRNIRQNTGILTLPQLFLLSQSCVWWRQVLCWRCHIIVQIRRKITQRYPTFRIGGSSARHISRPLALRSVRIPLQPTLQLPQSNQRLGAPGSERNPAYCLFVPDVQRVRM